MAAAFLMEIRRATQSALLVVRAAAELPSAPVEVSMCAESLEVRSGGSCDAAALPAGVSLAPSSCRGLRRLRGDGLHLRVRLRHPPPAADVVFTLRESLKPNKNYIFYCQSCGDIVVNDRKFLRVLPLPSENWSDLVEEWCCHPDPFARRTLHPQHGDCFVGDTFLLLNSRNESHVPESPVCCSEAGHHVSQSDSNLKSKENTRVICKRCKTMLGETVSSGTIKYYVTEVFIQSAEGGFSPTPRSQFVQSIVAQCLLELSSAKSTFRFTIKGDNGKTYILIWILNSDTLLVESLGSSSSHSDFTLFGDILTPSCGPVGSWNALKVLYQPCIQCRNKDQHRSCAVMSENFAGSDQLSCPLWMLTLLRSIISPSTSSSKKQSLLSCTGSDTTPLIWKDRESKVKKLADAWEDDMGVHPLKFPSETCLELLLILGLSTTSLPPSLRCMNSFQVAFLKM